MEQISFPHLPVYTKKTTAGTFVPNMQLPVHRWFRYSAGFSAEWVKKEIHNYYIKFGKAPNVFDPFTGSGTVLLEAEKIACPVIGVESHPFVSRITKSKLMWRSDIDSFNHFALSVLDKAPKFKKIAEPYPDLIHKCFTQKNLLKLNQLKKAFMSMEDKSPASQLTWLAITSILRSCSHVGTAQCEYIQPKKRKIGAIDPYIAFWNKVCDFKTDMMYVQKSHLNYLQAKMIVGDMRNKLDLPKNWGDLVITSPPYANNYDYADAVRLELSFWGEVQSWRDLQTTIRPHLIRSCTQHITSFRSETYKWLANPFLYSIKGELNNTCKKLELMREQKRGKKAYHTMLVAYFLDMAKVWHNLRYVMKPYSKVCFVIGDSAPYGIYVPVDKWLGELALSAGFKEYYFEKIRDRNIKWKNRKHRVPLKEGYLWVKG